MHTCGARFPFLLLATTLVTAACAGQFDPGTGDDDDAVVPDADPGQLPQIDAGPPAGDPDAAAPAGPQPGDEMACIDYQESRTSSDPSWGLRLTDIAQHLPPSYGDQYWDTDLLTAAHETTHGINSDLRNYHNDTGQTVNGFYVLGDCGVIVVEPNLRKSDVIPYLPQALRGYRYDTYITGQTAWDDTPTYIFDEWVAYTNHGDVGVELVEAGLWTYPWQDGVSGSLEFTIYSLALGMAVKALDPTYFSSNQQFREFLAWNARRAMTIFRKGKDMPAFTWDDQDAMYEALRTSGAAADMRQFCRDTWGEPFTNELLGL